MERVQDFLLRFLNCPAVKQPYPMSSQKRPRPEDSNSKQAHSSTSTGAKPGNSNSCDSLEEEKKRQMWFDDPARSFIKKPEKECADSPKAPFPANRFDIKPGKSWDGIDRSNGFERRYLKACSEKSSLRDVAYKWRTEEM